jgi:IS1 family transposase
MLCYCCPKTRPHPAEVNSTRWSSETSAHGVSHSTTRKTDISTTANSIITAMTGAGSLSPAAHNPASETRALIERLLVERISLRGLCRAVGVTRKWLLGFLVQCFEALPDHLPVQPVRGTPDVMVHRLEGEADAMASFVQKKAHKQWVWIARDATSRQVMAFHVGDRSRKSARRLWAKMPQAYRHHATFYTDQYVVYAGVSPAVNTQRSAHLPGKPIISSASTTPCASVFLVWCVRHCPSRRSSPIILVPLRCLFATIT